MFLDVHMKYAFKKNKKTKMALINSSSNNDDDDNIIIIMELYAFNILSNDLFF